jgi:ribosomal protein S18 acetylase RimI-like enzyme
VKPSAGVTVTRLHPAQWEVLREARLKALRSDPAAFGARADVEAEEESSFWVKRLALSAWFIAYRGNEVVGVVACVAPPKERANEAQLDAMWVSPSWRGTGIAADLATAVIDHARNQGVRALSLTVAENNPAARRLYEKFGFAYTGERQPRRRDPHSFSERMVLQLDRSEWGDQQVH